MSLLYLLACDEMIIAKAERGLALFIPMTRFCARRNTARTRVVSVDGPLGRAPARRATFTHHGRTQRTLCAVVTRLISLFCVELCTVYTFTPGQGS